MSIIFEIPKSLSRNNPLLSSKFNCVVVSLMMTLFFLSPGALAKSNPDYSKKLKKGYHQLAIGNTDKAIKIFSRFAKKYPASGACHTALGQALKRKGRLNEAKAEFIKATQVEPKFAKGHYYLGVSLEQEKKWKQAADAFQTFVDLYPDNPNIEAMKGRVSHCRNQI